MFLLPEGKAGKAWKPFKSKALSEIGSTGQKITFAWAERFKGIKTLKTAQFRLRTYNAMFVKILHCSHKDILRMTRSSSF
jgi:hypothetical protein